MAFKRMPKHISGVNSGLTQLTVPFMTDFHPGDAVVFDDGTKAIVNAVDHSDAGTTVTFGKDPSRSPDPHSGRAPPHDFLIKPEDESA